MTYNVCGAKGHNKRYHNGTESSQNESTINANEATGEIPVSQYVPAFPSDDIRNEGLQSSRGEEKSSLCEDQPANGERDSKLSATHLQKNGRNLDEFVTDLSRPLNSALICAA
ncbi:hypothetical protein Fot_12503 [Forsythia ovata]|uniref:Uncharacterized protein n=1 Tax=Forsythia ovata TaxID=205694 RepID=A0ABD1WQK3_9LAMI